VKAVDDFSIHIKLAIDVRTNNGTKTSFTFAPPHPPLSPVVGGEGRVRGM